MPGCYNYKVVCAGKMVEGGSEGTFLLLLLLMAKGYTITRGRLRVSSAIKITIFMCLYTVTFCTLFIYEQMVSDHYLFYFTTLSSSLKFNITILTLRNR